MAIKGVVDRFEGDLAVLLVGEDETELVVPRSELPAGAAEGTWLRLGLEVDQRATAEAEERIGDKMSRLRQRGSRLAEGD
nr:DUF3006 domain-containing protein [Acidimicrobiia bacterium]